jgi:hypothetical protein
MCFRLLLGSKPIVIRLVWHEGIPRAVADMQPCDYAVGLVNRVDNPVAVPPAPVKQVAKIAVLGGGCASGRVFVAAYDSVLKPVEPNVGLGAASSALMVR